MKSGILSNEGCMPGHRWLLVHAWASTSASPRLLEADDAPMSLRSALKINNQEL
jgi:hypothetical protein